MQYLFAPVQKQWTQNPNGFPLLPHHPSHLIFVDDLTLIAPTPEEIHTMFKQVEDALNKGGLHVSKDKTAYITSLPLRATKCLPGHQHNKTGITILGRQFTLSDNTDAEMKRREAIAWTKFNKVRHILKAPTSIHHTRTGFPLHKTAQTGISRLPSSPPESPERNLPTPRRNSSTPRLLSTALTSPAGYPNNLRLAGNIALQALASDETSPQQTLSKQTLQTPKFGTYCYQGNPSSERDPKTPNLGRATRPPIEFSCPAGRQS